MCKAESAGEDYHTALAELRSTPRTDGFSPAELFFGRRLRGVLPSLSSQLHTDVVAGANARERTRAQEKSRHDARARDLPGLSVGDKVYVYGKTHKWDRKAQVIEVRDKGRSYIVQTDDGASLLRNRRFLQSVAQGQAEETAEGSDSSDCSVSFGPTLTRVYEPNSPPAEGQFSDSPVASRTRSKSILRKKRDLSA